MSGLLTFTALTGYGQQQQDATGRILLEQWSVTGSAISSLTNTTTNPNYPNRPAQRDYPHSLELVSSTDVPQGDNYGTRFRGYLQAPASGAYTFYVAGDDNAELYLSTTDSPANATLIASASNTGLRTYTQFPSQQSAVKNLTGGQRYYIEVRHKQGTGGSHVSVAWQVPGSTAIVPVNGNYLSAFQVAGAVPATAAVLNNLTTARPRVLGSALTFARTKARILVVGSPSERSYGLLRDSALRLLPVPVVVKPTTDDEAVKRSRFITERVRLLAFVYRLSNEPDKDKYKNRAWLELENIISNSTASPAWNNWNPRGELLDVAELTTAAAIGYDWLYTALDTTQRGKLRRAIITKGLNVGLGQYNAQNNATQQANRSGWSNQPYNWNAVCNAGFTLGALAIAGQDDSTPAVNANTNAKARDVLGHVFRTLPLGVSDFAPDGGWDEGPGYWEYATSRLVNLFSTTEAALGSSFGLADAPGLSETGLYPIYINRPGGITFNHGDGRNTLTPGPHMMWMAHRYNKPAYASHRNNLRGNTLPATLKNSFSELDLLWYSARHDNTDLTSLAKDRLFASSQVALLRSAWQDVNATYVGLKAGNNKEGHEQLDIGTFVLDALGYKWAEELGNDSYSLKNYFETKLNIGGTWPNSPRRYDYYRIRAEGQNTLLINPSTSTLSSALDQIQTLNAPITRTSLNGTEAFAIADLQPAYADRVTTAQRGIRLFDNRSKVLIQDEIVTTRTTSDVWWQMHTRTPNANIVVQPDGKSVLLTQGSGTSAKRLWLHIVSGPASAVFAKRAATLLVANPTVDEAHGDYPAQDRNGGVTKIYVRMTTGTNTTLAIEAIPLNSTDALPTATYTYATISPLNEWGVPQNRDLVVTTLSASPAAPTVGQPVTFSATIRNSGTTATPAGIKHGVAFKVDGVVVSWGSTYNAMAPGTDVVITATGGPNAGASTWPATGGGHIITAEVDDSRLITETTETNNTRTMALNIGATVGPVHDTYVRAGSFANTTHGTTNATIDATNLLTKHNDAPEYEREAYLTFSLANLPGPVSSARLRLYKDVTSAPAGTIAVGAYSVAAPTWTETALTWNTKPATSATPLVTTDAPAAAGYIEWDVTSYVAAQKSQGQSAVGFALKNIPSAAETLVWNSKEAATNRPQLVLGFGAAARGILAAATQSAASNANLTLYPNPAQNAVTVELTSAAAQPVKIRVTSALGQALDLQTISVPAGLSRHTLDTHKLANGLYLLTVQQGTSTSTQRLLIAR